MKCKKIGNARIYHSNNKVSHVVLMDKKVEIARINRAFSFTGGNMFGIPCRTNGLGPSNNPALTKALSKTPFAKAFKVASNFHDVLYALGIAVTTRETADKVWYHINKIESIRPIKGWFKRMRYYAWNRSFYRTLRVGGSSSWGVTDD